MNKFNAGTQFIKCKLYQIGNNKCYAVTKMAVLTAKIDKEVDKTNR